jgi:hypothetical protein
MKGSNTSESPSYHQQQIKLKAEETTQHVENTVTQKAKVKVPTNLKQKLKRHSFLSLGSALNPSFFIHHIMYTVIFL